MSGDVNEAPCGCKFGTVGDAFWFEPCALTCDLYAWMCQEAERQGKPPTTLDMREEQERPR